MSIIGAAKEEIERNVKADLQVWLRMEIKAEFDRREAEAAARAKTASPTETMARAKKAVQ